ncbi:class I SAM-dependent methyltransferase [Methylorubrum thiocyanatum]|uniref:class I SAM-dependent methyltransferase n=1 Tax=Methylorubrum thiocyanatum TaxID=47958 RepID=UPI003F81E192
MENRKQLSGHDYMDVLAKFHAILRPKNYFEIGTRDGRSLDLAKCPSIAIDPNFILTVSATSQRSETFFFQKTSDDFFNEHDPKTIFGRPIDFAFLDGLHLYEFLLRDFINTEKHCKKNSIIAMHDVLPLDAQMAERPDTGGWWTGDVWKVVLILKKYRPDINIYCFDAPQTGLLVVTGLNPLSKDLEDKYREIIDEWADVSLADYGVDRFHDEAGIVSTSMIDTPEDMLKRFWL